MRESDRAEIKYLRSLTSKEAADWIVAHYPDFPPPIIHHLSWQKPEQVRLFIYYYPERFAFGHGRHVDAFLTIMPPHRFARYAEPELHNLPVDKLSLFSYYLAHRPETEIKSLREKIDGLLAHRQSPQNKT